MTEPTNEMVAKLVMGWGVLTGSTGTIYVDGCMHDVGSFEPLTSVADDFRVFQCVRSQIDEGNPAYKDYYKHLRAVLSQNPESGPDDPDDSNLYLIHWYRPGDYSRAALAALKQSVAIPQ